MNILVIEDEIELAKLYEIFLTKEGHQVHIENSSPRALTLLSQTDFDLIISDYHMPKVTGLDIAKFLIQNKPQTPLFIISGEEKNKDLPELATIKFFKKPFPFNDLIKEIDKLNS